MCSFNQCIIRRTKNGALIRCKNTGEFQLLYKNLNISLNQREHKALLNYISNIDIDYWETEYKDYLHSKKIPIPTVQKNLILMLDRYEVFELIYLLNYRLQDFTLDVAKIDYQIVYN